MNPKTSLQPASTVSITTLRRQFTQYLNLAIESGPVVVTRRNKPVVVLIAEPTYRELIERIDQFQKPGNAEQSDKAGFAVIEVELPDWLLRAAQEHADRAGISLNDFLVQSIEEFVHSYGGKPGDSDYPNGLIRG